MNPIKHLTDEEEPFLLYQWVQLESFSFVLSLLQPAAIMPFSFVDHKSPAMLTKNKTGLLKIILVLPFHF